MAAIKTYDENGNWIYAGGLPGRTTSGLHVYSHTGTTQGELGVDTTVTDDSSNLVTSGAVADAIDDVETQISGKASSSDLTSHTGNTSNPHGVTAEQTTYNASATSHTSGSVGAALSEQSEQIVTLASSLTNKTATQADVGKMAKIKTVGQDGKVSEWEFGEGGSGGGVPPQIVITTIVGSVITVSKGSTVYTRTATGTTEIFDVNDYGTWSLNATKDSYSASLSLLINEVRQYHVALQPKAEHIWGVQWEVGASTVLSRTDDAVGYADPIPYVAGASSYSSPFDIYAPWKDIKRVTDPAGGEMVEIPKFWYKITKSGTTYKFQIADYAADGFRVSPAHSDRWDGKGVRDKVYIGRYHSNTNGVSQTGVSPCVNVTREQARTKSKAVGTGFYQLDYATWWTIDLLYLVEFADWDCQKVIGYGRGNGSAVQAMGYTDSMPYHTGTTKSTRTQYGVSTQYRYIEGLWDNCIDWCDGIVFSGASVYGILNPNSYSDSTSSGTLIGTRSTASDQCIKNWFVPTASGFEWALYPSELTGASNYTEYCADAFNYSAGGVVLSVGGSYYQNLGSGLFCRNGSNAASSSGAYIGFRLLKLP